MYARLLILVLAGLQFVSWSHAAVLESGAVRLSVQPGAPAQFSLIQPPSVAFQADWPLCLQMLTKAGTTLWLSNRYSSVMEVDHGLHCAGIIRTPAGSVFEIHDSYRPGPGSGAWELNRELVVREAAGQDDGFLSRFSVRLSAPRKLSECEVFVPGIWYQENHNVPSYALAADLSEAAFVCREDRLPLPLVMMRDKGRGTTLTLIHAAPDGATCLADYAAERVVDARIHVASLGVLARSNAAATFCYPASEGERSYLRQRVGGKGWVERFHPVRAGFSQSYSLVFDLSRQSGFAPALRHAWRLAFETIHPPVAQVDLGASYEASIQLIAHWARTTRGAPGVPFRLRLPQGELEDQEKINYQMGFVGQQLPLASHLLRYGLEHTNEVMVQRGAAMVDFWATHSLTADGLPRTWFDTWPEPHWRRYDTYLRVASDGLAGALVASDVMAAAGRPKTEWLAFCRRFGDWLVAHQNPDGSWYREFNLDSTPAHTGKQNTCQPIRFLVDLSQVTGDRHYLEAAVRAGNWCWTHTHQAFCYVGGTVDNPNVTDKEAGFLALEAFLALHDATGERRWLEAATQAADFTETWAYCWNVPIPAEDPRVTYPRGAATTGFSLIACGHSGADLFLAGAPFFFYRLYLQTGETHYAEIARQLLYDTRQSMDINGSQGYGFPGLCTEALSLAPPRGHGVNTWLPWLSYSMMEPVVRLQQAYGVMDTPLLDGRRRAELLARDQLFGRTRGLLSAKPGGSGRPAPGP